MASAEDEVLTGLHQLLKNIEPTLKSASGSLDVAEDVLLHLEETDESFHKHDFVKYIRENIETYIGPLVDEEIEKRSISGAPNSVSRQETLVQAVAESAVESRLFSDLTQKICSSTSSAANTLLRSLDEEHNSMGSDEEVESQLSKRMRSVFSEGASTCGSSFNQGMFFMSQEQFHCIADEMDCRKPIDIRRDALTRLCHVPPSDVMASESWSQLRVSLMDALADPDPFLSHTTLSFHAKMFAVSNYQIMRETYTCLAEHLIRWFKSSSQSLPSIYEPLDITKSEVVLLIKRIRLLNEFQCEVPSIWVRYPESFLEVIVDSSLSLLCLQLKLGKNSNNSDKLTALHFLSLIDIRANWFRKWLHGNYSRATLINSLEGKYQPVLQDAVLQCLTFCRDSLSKPKSHPHHTPQDGRRTTYTPNEIRYARFVHSLCFVSRLLFYTGGRELFPVSIDIFPHPISVQHLLISWIQLIGLAKSKPKHGHKAYEPASLVCKAICNLCLSNAFVEQCVGDEVISVLLIPIRTWLEPSSKRYSESCMLHIAEILACLTSTCAGRKLLLHGSGSEKKSAAAHVIAEFAQKSLNSKLPSGTLQSAGNIPSYSVVGAFVFVCRQMYNVCEGLLLLLEYNLHQGIAAAWKQAHEKWGDSHAVPLKFDDSNENIDEQSSPTQSSSRNLVLWEETLLDNLLNFAATPKGLLLLQQTGAINECVAYMHSRYTKKLQVSKCEKFGYGVMVTQVAATAAGTSALYKAGFLRAIIHELWSHLEHATDEIRMTAPRPFPLHPIDRSVHKSFMGLVNVLSSYPAVHELFYQQQLPNKTSYTFREMPESPINLIDRLVMINSEAKIHALFNYEQSHVFGLRLLAVLACHLDSWLLLETQYNIQHTLLELQKNNRTIEGEIIIDRLSIERNYLLVKTHMIGGEGERLLPSRSLDDNSQQRRQRHYVWPLFYHFPIPKEYTPTIASQTSMKKESALSRFLASSKSSEKNRQWLEQLRSTFCKVMKTAASTVRGGVLIETIEKTIQALERMPEERVFKKTPTRGQFRDSGSASNNNLQNIGVKLAIRYGKQINALKANPETAAANLVTVLRTCSQFLAQQQSYSSVLKLTSGPYPCYDWFVSSIFLMVSGSKDRSLSILMKLSELLCSGYLWPARLHASIHLSEGVRASGIPPVFSCTGHHVELILQAEHPLIYSAFRMSGYTPSQITQHWLTQCFWNYLTWTQVTHYIVTVITMGCDYQVYICVSILKHLQHEILSHRQTQDLQVFLKENPIEGFVVSEWFDYMNKLEQTYRNTVLTSMRNIA
uniref:protein broad-minded-like n=1 Tax=Ciona intestinalis TaxID=7719 RepID=UPI00089DD319|nr:protein broad-minded-like [Ciona intestinalis]|eukprot:XP_018668106.1 protein broad-minded-like [Ciona intestinalis]